LVELLLEADAVTVASVGSPHLPTLIHHSRGLNSLADPGEGIQAAQIVEAQALAEAEAARHIIVTARQDPA
jgi:hypothetical protein